MTLTRSHWASREKLFVCLLVGGDPDVANCEHVIFIKPSRISLRQAGIAALGLIEGSVDFSR
jgi:hypothetical protein